jgi:MFS family permease
MLAELREGWSEFRSHTWLWVIVAQFGVVMMAWYGSFSVLGPVVAEQHLGGPAAWGAITAADAFGLIAGGIVSLRITPRRPMLFVVLTGGAVAISPLSLAMVLPLAAVCVASFGLGVFVEVMMVQWTVTMARNIPSDKLARVSSYDVLGTVIAMPAGALIAGPLGTEFGASRPQYAAAALIVAASALALIPRDIRRIRNDQGEPAVPADQAGDGPADRSGGGPRDSDTPPVRKAGPRRSSDTSGTSAPTRPRTPPPAPAGRRSAPRSRSSQVRPRLRNGRSEPPS